MNESHPLTLTAPTRLSESEWRQLLTPEPDIERSDVTVDPNGAPGEFGLLEITLPADTEYDLRMAKVGVGSRVRGREAAYVTDIEGGGTVTEGGSDRLVVEVRDRYNNPISGVTVNASTDTDDSVASLAEINATTDDDGRAEFVYRTKGASVNSDTRDFVNVSITRPQSALNQSSFDGGEPGDLSVEYTVTPRSGSTNQASYDLFWTDTTSVPGPTGSSAEVCDSFPCNVTLQATTDPAQVAAPVGFGTGDSNLVRVLERLNATQSGVAGTTVQFRPSTGNTTLVTQSGGTSDTLVVSTPSAVDFESGLGDYGVFGNFEGDDPEQSSQNSNSGSFAVVLEGGNDGGIVTTGYDTTGGESVVLQYWVKESDVGDIGDGNGGLRVEYLTGSGSWVTADSLPLTGTNPGEVRTARLGSDAIHDNFSLRFRQIGADNANDEWLIDNPTITALGTEVGPGEPGSGDGGNGGGADNPSVTITDAGETGNSRKIQLDADFSDPVGDGNELTSVDIEVRDEDGNPVYTDTADDISGDSASLTDYMTTVSLRGNNDPEETFTVEITVSDTDGNTGSDQATVDV
ncbi:Ig-like domain-containing protein [Halorientalis marina]|uniref:Ig-like domain-containing protein n=1 Tax=Halorientalis marina TaxID=2931976 RepID=UPI001FF19B81|nr:Ig-like domain-containing protein [Halorientalis marina]